MPLSQPHVVFRTRPRTQLTDYWTGTGWSPDSTKAKPVEWARGIDLITIYRRDEAMRDCGFGMTPASQVL